MARREFQFREGTSDKFWAITVDGAGFTVQFGRTGSAGQTQVKTFGSAAEAQQAADKLIAEKVRKGYVEVAAASGAPAAAAAPVAPKGKAKPSAPAPDAAPAAPPALAVHRAVTVDSPYWLHLPGQPWQSRPRPEAKAFDLKDCLVRLRQLNMGRLWSRGWEKCRIAPALSPPEAAFWLEAMTRVEYNTQVEKLAADLARLDYKKPPTRKAIVARLREAQVGTSDLALPVANLLPPEDLCGLLAGEALVKDRNWSLSFQMMDGFLEHVLPYLTEAEAERAREVVRPALDPASEALVPWALAGVLGLREELRTRVASLPDAHFEHTHGSLPLMIVLDVGDAREAEAQARRLRLHLAEPEHIRAWLALTGWTALDYVRDCIPPTANKAFAEPLIKTLASGVQAPEAAPIMLDLRLSSKAPGPARQWLDDAPGNAIAGLLPVAAGKGKLAEAAREYLREAIAQGHGAFLDEQLAGQPADVVEAVVEAVLMHDEKVYEPLDAKSTPSWLKGASAAGAKLPGWVRPSNLPPILVGGRRLTEDQTTGVLEALRTSPLGKPSALVAALKEHADRASLDAFAWKLFEQWLGEGAPSKDKWGMLALGHLGADAVALKLTPLVRAWPGEGQHPRAVTGLECLRAIGTDTALMQLNGVAQRVKFKGIQNKAREFMEGIAQDRGLTREQLEDRIVPDLGLDERGRRVFDFGPRQFRFVLGPDLRPLVRDEADKVKDDLPRPGAKDDPAKAEAAVADWKLLKKQLREVVKVQAFRLEQAMVTDRRWTATEFDTLLVRHPLMLHLVRRLVWGGFDSRGKRVRTFRVTEEQECVDAEDRACSLDGLSVGILHPLHMSEAERSKWGGVFGDYEIIAPFPQLGRAVYGLEKGEAKAKEITRLAGKKLPGVSVASYLEKSGWQRGPLHDHGDYYQHYKHFESADVTAVTHYEPGLWASNIADPIEVEVERCVFLKGRKVPQWSWTHDKATPMKLADVDAVVLSEVLADLSALAAKAE